MAAPSREPQRRYALPLAMPPPFTVGRSPGPLVRLALVCAFPLVAPIPFVAFGHPHSILLAASAVAERTLIAGGLAALYLAAALGFGSALRRFIPIPVSVSFLWACGLGFLLWMSHVLGWTGLLGGNLGNSLSLAVLLIGVGLAFRNHAAQVWRCLRTVPLTPAATAGLIGLALLLAAAANPPGWLWESEFGGYDALSYHLALPQQWLGEGSLRSLDTNVYSYLPGYIEAAFMHLGAASFAPAPSDRPWGLVAGEGYRVLACQYLHAGIAALAAWNCADAAGSIARAKGLSDGGTRVAFWSAGTLVLVTPWTIVTGSLAYNDMGVVLMLGASLFVLFDSGLSPARRGALLGLFAGAACSIKPTALLFVAVPLGVGLAMVRPAREWPGIAVSGCVAGLAMMLPWLVRNWLASGSPVFPFAAAIFSNPDGSMGHWSAEQVARYAGAHAPEGTIAGRVALLLFPEGGESVSRWRGITHPQWGLFLPAVLLAGVAALTNLRTRRVGAVLLAMLGVQLVTWVVATHQQSRFLLPMLALGAVLFALVLGAIARHRAAILIAGATCALQASALIWTFARQRGGNPNAILVEGVPVRTGEMFIRARESLTETESGAWLEAAGPEAYVNAVLPGEVVLGVGGATPLYFAGPVRMVTTWDTNPLAEIMARRPDQPESWTSELRLLGIEHLLVDFGELDRLERSGWLDPSLRGGRVRDWFMTSGRHIRTWPRAGIVLIELREQGESP